MPGGGPAGGNGGAPGGPGGGPGGMPGPGGPGNGPGGIAGAGGPGSGYGGGGGYSSGSSGGYSAAPVAPAYGNAYGTPGSPNGTYGQGPSNGLGNGLGNGPSIGNPGQGPGGTPAVAGGMAGNGNAAGNAYGNASGNAFAGNAYAATSGSSNMSPNHQPTSSLGQDGTAQAGPAGPPVVRPEGYVEGHPAVEQAPPRRDPSRYDEQDVSHEPITALRPGEYQPRIDQDPPRDEDKDKDKDRKKVQSLAADRGLDWSLRDAQHGAAAISRPIRVDCFADHLAVAPEPGVAAGKIIPMPRGAKAAITPFVAAIWERLDAWGMAGNRMYWRPVLEIHVAPGGQQAFQDLCVLLEGSGMNIERKL